MAATLAAWLGLLASASAQPPLPRFDGQTHLGVATCAGPCHGRQSALGVAEGPAMRGSEIVVWQDLNTLRGRHSQAYKVLEGERARDIARKLGIGEPTRAQECLSCHMDDPPAALRGPQFQASDGVSCEACHGGAGGKWLASHYAPGATHAQNVANGMYPVDQPAARARLCESCHIGSASPDQYVAHRIMGAGHPRLTYELELFTALQAHHYEDQDYASRKPIPNRAKVWAIGQAAAFRQELALFLDSPHSHAGIFPEETFFDCRSCHRLISDSDSFRSHWRANPGRPQGPGTPVFNDANLIVLSAAARATSPTLAAQLDARGRAFDTALQANATATHAAGEALIATLGEVQAEFERTRFDPALARAMLKGVVSESLSARYTTYQGAEQAIMAVDSLNRAVADAGRVLPPAPLKPGQAAMVNPQPDYTPPPKPPEPPAKAEIDAAYKTVADPNAYDQEAFRRAVAQVARKLGLS